MIRPIHLSYEASEVRYANRSHLTSGIINFAKNGTYLCIHTRSVNLAWIQEILAVCDTSIAFTVADVLLQVGGRAEVGGSVSLGSYIS